MCSILTRIPGLLDKAREPEKGKVIRVFQLVLSAMHALMRRNGEVRVSGKNLALNSRNCRSFDGAMQMVRSCCAVFIHAKDD